MMDCHWDKNKERDNRSKHGIAFADAIAVFADDNALTEKMSIQMKSDLSRLAWMLLAEFSW